MSILSSDCLLILFTINCKKAQSILSAKIKIVSHWGYGWSVNNSVTSKEKRTAREEKNDIWS